MPKQTLQETVERYLQSCDNVRQTPVRMPLLWASCKLKETDIPLGVVSKENVKLQAPLLELQRLLSQQQSETVRLVATGLERLEIPKREVLSYDGDPREYPRFI